MPERPESTVGLDAARSQGLSRDEWDSLAASLAPAGRSAATQPLLESATERYVPLTELGRGGMGEVWRVWDLDLNRRLAMKVLRGDLELSESSVGRFVEEAQVTAQLQHPGIVPVHDVGQTPDGRTFFTMKEVEGETLSAVIEQRGSDDEGSLRGLVEVVRRVAEAVGFAHSRGVTHRDLKPSNLMVGGFGEVYVMDWGLASVLGDASPVDTDRVDVTRAGALLGTPAYMAPEQARGESATPATDVFLLGGVLFSVLTGSAPIPGDSAQECIAAAARGEVRELRGPFPIPEDLGALCLGCLSTAQSERPRSGTEVAALLGDWLDGARRKEQVDALVEEADALSPAIAELRQRSAERHRASTALLGDLPTWASDEEKRPGWRLQEEAAELRLEAVQKETRWLRSLQSALRLLPDDAAVNQRLASYWRRRHEDAEARQDAEEAARSEAQLRAYDRGAHRAYLDGDAWLTLVTDPPGATAALFRFGEVDRRLKPRWVRDLGPTPIERLTVPHGSYLVVLTAPGRATVRYPVFLERGRDWRGIRPGDSEPTPVRLPVAGELGPEDVLVPGGWAWTGGDPEAGEPLPRRRLWIDSFVVKQFPVTNAEYLAFLNDLLAEGRESDALDWAPRDPLSTVASTTYFVRGPNETFALGVDEEGTANNPRNPVRLVTWFGAAAYAEWVEKRTGQPWRLLNELEWEKAARGVDGRPFIWGAHREPHWANTLGAYAEVPRPAPVGSWPRDVSVYGVRDLAGNVRDWCGNAWTADGPVVDDGRLMNSPGEPGEFMAMRGGAWVSVGQLNRLCTRFGNPPGQVLSPGGFRLALSTQDSSSVD